MSRHCIIATAGHVDHGKSALLKALTGTDPDRLPEEKARGITIDLGFAHLQLPGAEASGGFDLGIVDVPGHEDFVANMVAGAGSIDLALLVVAVDDGWMPQTEEHLQILTYLGVSRAVVALTKVDLVEGEESAQVQRVREKLRGTLFEQSPIVPTSVVTGRGLEELKAALGRELDLVPPAADIGKPRLPVDRAFTLPGIGTVVTGTLRGGCLHAGQEVLIQPGGGASRIRSLQTYNRQVERAGPSTRTALNLSDVVLESAGRSGAGDLVVRRGCVITLPGLGRAGEICEVLLERSPRPLAGPGPTARPLRHGTRVRVHIGSGNVPGRLHFSLRQELGAGENCVAQLRLEAPVYVFVGDRFVIRDWAEQSTLAGGVVLDACAQRKFHPVFEELGVQTFTAGDLTPQHVLKAHLHARRFLRQTALLAQSNFSPAEVSAALAQLSASGECVRVGDFALEAGDWQALRERAQSLIDHWHKAHPEQAGLSLADLRSALSPGAGRALRPGAPDVTGVAAGIQLPAPEPFEVLVAELLNSGFAQAGSVIQRKGYRPQLPAPLQAATAKLRSLLALKPLDPPSRKELAPDRASQEALAFLVRVGEVVELGPDLVLSAAAFARATEAVRQFLREHRSGTVSELRQALGASRRVVVPLLERLDREGLTRREGDTRCLKAPAPRASSSS